MSLSLALWTTDIGAMSSFLEGVAGGRLLERHPGFAAVRLGNTTLTLHGDEAMPDHPWYEALGREGAARGIGAEVRIAVESVDEAFRGALGMGCAGVQWPNSRGEGVREAHVLGPDGYLFVFWSVDSSQVI